MLSFKPSFSLSSFTFIKRFPIGLIKSITFFVMSYHYIDSPVWILTSMNWWYSSLQSQFCLQYYHSNNLLCFYSFHNFHDEIQRQKRQNLTCAAHFLSVSTFYSSSFLFMYVRPNSGNKDDNNISISLYKNYYIKIAIFYTLLIPLLNPVIYSLRNKEVISVLKKIMEKNL